MPRPALQLQRLLASGHGSLPEALVVDVGAILRWARANGHDPDVLHELVAAAKRTQRHMLWILSPPTLDPPSESDVDVARTLLRAVSPETLVFATEAAPSLVVAAATLSRRGGVLGIVSAEMESNFHELFVLNHVAVVYDAATGSTHDYFDTAWSRELEPAALPLVAAATGVAPDSRPITRDAPRHRRAIAQYLIGEGADSLPKWVRDRLDDPGSRARLEGMACRLETSEVDSNARGAIVRWLDAAFAATADVVVWPTIEGTGPTSRVVGASVSVAGTTEAVNGHEIDACLRAAVARNPGRWVVPHALDFAGWMHERGIPLPAFLADPAIAAHALSPDARLDLADSVRAPEVVNEWLFDTSRDALQPPNGLSCDDLARIDAGLNELATSRCQAELLKDLEATLPVLAKLERQGAVVEPTSSGATWNAISERLRNHLRGIEALFPGMDPYQDRFGRLSRALMTDAELADALCGQLTAKQKCERLAAQGVVRAVALGEARTIGCEGGILTWVRKLADCGGRLRGRLVPQRNGRWAYRDVDLQNLPKHTRVRAADRELRETIRAPNAMAIVQADFNAFELRLAAALSGDPALLKIARTRGDAHAENAAALFPEFDGASAERQKQLRGHAKSAFLAIMYGQQRDGFRREMHDMTKLEAEALFDRILARYPELLAYRAKLKKDVKKSKELRIPGDWVRRVRPSDVSASSPEAAAYLLPKNALNTIVQGTAAAVFRAVLRQLDRELPTEARLLVQIHDEVHVGCPQQRQWVERTKEVVTRVMEDALGYLRAPLPYPVVLVANAKEGNTWADVS